MNYAILCAELSGDPLGRGYAATTDQEAAAALNAVDRAETCARFVTVRTLMSEIGPAQAASIVAALEAQTEGNAVIALALDMLKTYAEGGGIDIGCEASRAMLDELAAAEVLTAGQAAAIKALGEQNVSRASELGIGTVLPGHVQKARFLLAANG